MRVHFLSFFLVLTLGGQADSAPLRPTKPTTKATSEAGPVSTTIYRPLPDRRKTPIVYPDLTHKPWWFFASFDLGMISYSSVSPGIEATRNGFSGGVRGLISRSFDDFVADGGLGFQYNAASGVNSDTKKVSTNARLGFIDLSARYKIGPRFQIGPEFNYWVNSDNGLNIDPLSSTDLNHGKLLGVEALFEWDRMRKYRFGGRWLANVGAPARGLNQFQVFLQIGFDVFSGDEAPVMKKNYEQVSPSDLEKAESLMPKESIPMKTPEPAPEQSFSEPAPDVMSTPAPPPPESTPEPAPVAPLPETAAPESIPEPVATVAPVAPRAQKKLILSMGFNDLPFGFNDAELPIPHQTRVKNIGRFLAKKNHAWKSLLVSGHTDSRGSKKLNMDLSLRRAETVRRLLIEGGVHSNKVKAIGYGETKPLDSAQNEKAHARNRRVELEFTRVSDAEAIKHALDQ